MIELGYLTIFLVSIAKDLSSKLLLTELLHWYSSALVFSTSFKLFHTQTSIMALEEITKIISIITGRKKKLNIFCEAIIPNFSKPLNNVCKNCLMV